MKNILKNFQKKFKELSIDEKFIIIFVCSIFIHLVVCAVVALIYLIYIIKSKQFVETLTFNKFNYFVIIFLVFSLIVAIIHVNLLGICASIIASVLTINYFHYRRYLTIELFEIIINIITVLSLFDAVVGISQYFIIQKQLGFTWTIDERPEYRVVAGFYNAGYYATILEFIILISLYEISVAKNTVFSKRYYIFILILNMCMLYLTGTRTAWGALALAANALFLATRKYFAFIIFAIGELLFIYIGIYKFQVFPRVDSMVTYFFDRVDIWKTGLDGFRLHPLFGQGSYTYKLIYEQVDGVPTMHAHSIYVDTILSYGIILTVLLLIYVFSGIFNLFKNRNSPYFPLSIALIVALLVHGIGDITIVSVQVLPLYLILVTAASTIKHKKTTL